MANHRSAEKRHLRSLKKNALNRANRSRLAGQIKKARAAIKDNEPKKLEEVIKAQSLLAKLAQKGVIHRKTAQRRTARIMSQAAAA